MSESKPRETFHLEIYISWRWELYNNFSSWKSVKLCIFPRRILQFFSSFFSSSYAKETEDCMLPPQKRKKNAATCVCNIWKSNAWIYGVFSATNTNISSNSEYNSCKFTRKLLVNLLRKFIALQLDSLTLICISTVHWYDSHVEIGVDGLVNKCRYTLKVLGKLHYSGLKCF